MSLVLQCHFLDRTGVSLLECFDRVYGVHNMVFSVYVIVSIVNIPHNIYLFITKYFGQIEHVEAFAKTNRTEALRVYNRKTETKIKRKQKNVKSCTHTHRVTLASWSSSIFVVMASVIFAIHQTPNWIIYLKKSPLTC